MGKDMERQILDLFSRGRLLPYKHTEIASMINAPLDDVCAALTRLCEKGFLDAHSSYFSLKQDAQQGRRRLCGGAMASKPAGYACVG